MEKKIENKEARLQEIREKGIEFYLSPAKKHQKRLLEADIVKMVEDNIDILLDAADSRESTIDVAELFEQPLGVENQNL